MSGVYYEVEVTLNMPNGGHYVMITDERNDYYPNDREWRLLKYNQMPGILPDLERCKTSKGDVLPDVVDHYFFNFAPGLFFNERTKNIFTSFNLGGHLMCPGSIVHKKKVIPYFWMHIASNLHEFVDYKNSLFVIGDYKDKTVEKYIQSGHIKNLDEYTLYRKELKMPLTILPIKIQFKPDFKADLDLIYIENVASEIYLSERLVSELQKNNITGLTYQESRIFDL